jgi:DNA-directed RNA polymerase subunit RPC12/RpoP
MLKKFCGKCKKELGTDSKYLLCEDCHKRIIFLEDDREFYENSRIHY